MWQRTCQLHIYINTTEQVGSNVLKDLSVYGKLQATCCKYKQW